MSINDLERVIDLATSEPERAQALLVDMSVQPEERSQAARARGLIALRRGDARRATRDLETALREAVRASQPQRAAEARMSLAFARFALGDLRGALAETDAAVRGTRGRDQARVLTQRGLVLAFAGRLDEAARTYERALAALRREGDLLWAARVLDNRGVLHGYRADWNAAFADFQASTDLYSQVGHQAGAALVRHNLAWVDALRGRVPEALARFDEAEQQFRKLGLYVGKVLLDRAETLLSVSLVDEAKETAERALVAQRSGGMRADEAESRLLLARIAMRQGEPEKARGHARTAARMFRAQHREPWADLAEYETLRAVEMLGAGPAVLRPQVEGVAERLTRAGLTVQAADAHLLAMRLAMESDDGDAADRALVAVRGARRRGPPQQRARAWHAEALHRLSKGRKAAARRALDAGLDVLAHQQSTLGATELRTGLGVAADELARLGLRLSLEGGRARDVLRWSERWRAGALRFPAARPAEEGPLADALGALRGARAQLSEAVLGGRPREPLERRVAVAENVVQRLARHAAGDVTRPDRVDVPQLLNALGDRTLVEWIRIDGGLFAVVARGGVVRRRTLGAAATVTSELTSLRFAVRRMLRGGPTSTAARSSLTRSTEMLQRLLLEPLLSLLGDGDLVLAPTGPLHAVPWGLLPLLRHRSHTVAPSAASWRHAAASQTAEGPSVLAAGPRLAHADQEVDRLADVYRGRPLTCLHGPDATCTTVLAEMDGAGVAHLACHGQVRADNPLFSSLELGDGLLTVYDLEGLHAAPHRLVLSACEVGLSDVRPGEEVMGLAAALLSLGTRSVVASVLPVRDADVGQIMVELHRRLATGADAATALAAVRGGTEPGSAEWLAASSFTCFGAA